MVVKGYANPPRVHTYPNVTHDLDLTVLGLAGRPKGQTARWVNQEASDGPHSL
jgi:hypothetical protein